MHAGSQGPSVEPPSQVAEARTQSAAGATELAKSRRLEPLSPDRYGVHFTADGEFCALLERVRGLAGHRLPSGDLMSLLKRGLEAYERELEKERFAVGRKSRGRGETPATGELSASDVRNAEPAMPELPTDNPQPRFSRLKRTRYCAAAVSRAVFLRDGGQCTYVSSDGRRCRARRCLELDHIEPFAVGGEATIENLRLRCRAHNQRYARHYFGVFRMNAAIENFRRRRAPVRGERPGSGEHESRRSGGSARATAEGT